MSTIAPTTSTTAPSPTGPVPSASPRGGRRRPAAKIWTIVGLLFSAAFAILPVVWMFLSSLKPNTQVLQNPPRLFTSQSSFTAYRRLFHDPSQLDAFRDSYIIGAAVTLLTIVVAVLAGFSLSRFEYRGRSSVMTLVIGVQSVPPISLAIPYLGLITLLGLYDSYTGLILTHLVLTFPYAIVMMTAYFDTLPRSLDEAARVDGASSLRILWQILLPISVPGVVSVGVYTFMLSWNEFLFALLLTKTNVRTVPIRVSSFIGQNAIDWQGMFAMSIVGSLPVLAFFLVFQRYFLGGLTAGSVKG
ncbi:MAG: carbohydrate ABC transporter permease [bacterium]